MTNRLSICSCLAGTLALTLAACGASGGNNTATGNTMHAAPAASGGGGGAASGDPAMAGDQPAEGGFRTFHSHLVWHPSQGAMVPVPGGEATLVTSKDGAWIHVHATKLHPGFIHSLWWAVINNPKACASDPCTPKDLLFNTGPVKGEVGWADSGIAMADGTQEFNGFMPPGKTVHAWYGNGYTNITGAELLVVIQMHGAPIAKRIQKQLTTFRDGCTDKSIPKAFPPSAHMDGKPGPNKCATVQLTIFQQEKR